MHCLTMCFTTKYLLRTFLTAKSCGKLAALPKLLSPHFLVNKLYCCSQGLRAHGHNVTLGKYSAVTQAIVVDPDHDTLIGASDPRKDGAPAGY